MQQQSPTPTSVLVVVGTRPEAVKLAPVVLALRATNDLEPVVVTTGQHPDLADEALSGFGLAADHRLPTPRRRGWSQGGLMAHLLPGLEAVVVETRPDIVLVQGDTASALAGALAGFWRQVPVVHLEAGLRTPSLAEPFPEEGYRRVIARLATAHLAPTPAAVANLRQEGIPDAAVTCTGNTAVDAALICAAGDGAAPSLDLPDGGRLALLTVHRRESWGEPLRRILHGVRALLADVPDLRVVVPVHPNPLVRDVVVAELGDEPRVLLTEPLPYPMLVALLARADVVLTDSGGIQEEAPTFGTPVVVLRATTERAEAVAAGTAWLVGTDPAALHRRATALLAHPPDRDAVARTNPFGDGRAAGRAVEAIRAVRAGHDLPEGWSPTAPEPATPEPTVPEAPAPEADALPAWVRRMEDLGRPAATHRLDGNGPRLTPPAPTSVPRSAPGVGPLVEVRRGGQLLRHLPGAVPRLAPPRDTDEPWAWVVHQIEGDLWVESTGPPIRVHVPGGWCEIRSGAAVCRRTAGGAATVTVVTGSGQVRAGRGDHLALGPRQTTTIRPLGTLTGAGRASPAALDEDPWVRANRTLSHAGPLGATG
jgi:UDP-N-acetylglucosamine 2-epimerase (non-hydrolysing)